jgi:tRNA-splicing endonuclease subunit Sen2
VKLLWARGFFGKGSLSRSEPTWWIREQNRRGFGLALTSEEITAIRRSERREFKLVKAKERLAAAHAGVAPPLNASLAVPSKIDSLTRSTNQGLPWSDGDNAEHLQLEPVDAMYLLFALGSLVLRCTDLPEPLTPAQAFRLFASVSSPGAIQRDNDFVIKYIVYHHFRSLGWVVRSGIKFCTDFILYKGSDGTASGPRGAGPVGGHAEFSVVVVKRFKDPQDPLRSPEGESLLEGNEAMTWKWLSTVNRVTSGVKKARFPSGAHPAYAVADLDLRLRHHPVCCRVRTLSDARTDMHFAVQRTRSSGAAILAGPAEGLIDHIFVQI